MSGTVEIKVGTICWADLTVGDAERVRDFYQALVGWTHAPVDMGGYADYAMHAPGQESPVAGICHARGVNADLPPQWLIYIVVADLERSRETCLALGGEILQGPRDLGPMGRILVIRDPAGAVAALWEEAR